MHARRRNTRPVRVFAWVGAVCVPRGAASFFVHLEGKGRGEHGYLDIWACIVLVDQVAAVCVSGNKNSSRIDCLRKGDTLSITAAKSRIRSCLPTTFNHELFLEFCMSNVCAFLLLVLLRALPPFLCYRQGIWKGSLRSRVQSSAEVD